MLGCTLLVILFNISGFLCLNQDPLIKIPHGLLQGTLNVSRKGRYFNAFEGIPYAKPPIADLRFKEPKPADKWSGIWIANTYYQCLQLNHDPRHLGIPEGEEDCLYLNVYVPVRNESDSTELLDVIVHIHGGAFMFGHSDFYGPKNLMDRDVVYVNFNYRLGPLGFLSTEDDIVPGNNGMKDQVFALRWIKDNIKYFGGNPDSVTITGLSAGGSSVHYHYLSPMSRGLFQKGISLSGTALCNWALVEKPLEKTRKLAGYLGCNVDGSTTEIVNCLRRRSGKDITKVIKNFQPWLYNPYSPFGPVVENYGTNAFLPDYPYSLLKAGKIYDVPWITSVTTEEGLYPAAEFLYDENYLQHLDENWEEIAPHILHYNDTIPLSDQKQISSEIRTHYLQDKPISRETYRDLVHMIGDRLFVIDSEIAARLQAISNKSPVYYYLFSYRGSFSLSEYFISDKENVGVCHGDDLMYIMSPHETLFKYYLQDKADKKMCNILLDMWTNFAKTGNAQVLESKWTTILQENDDKFHYLNIISPDKQQMESADYLGHRPFWDTLPFNENHQIQERDEL